MSLDPRPSYPQSLCYVLKLHRDSSPGTGRLQGVLEHVASGAAIPFQSASALQAALLAHVSGMHACVAATDCNPDQ